MLYHYTIDTELPEGLHLMTTNPLMSAFIQALGRKNDYFQELQRHSDAERIAFIDETFVDPSYDKKLVSCAPATTPSQPSSSKPTTSPSSAKTSPPPSEVSITGTPLTLSMIEV